MNSSVFAKTQENLRKRVHVEMITDAGILRKRVARGNSIIDCLTAVQCKIAIITLNLPIYVGSSVLELSKLHVYDFHYNHMRVKYPRPGQLQLLYTDTDSLAYAVQTDDICRDTAEDAANRYDFSKYPFDLYTATNRKSLGFFKD